MTIPADLFGIADDHSLVVSICAVPGEDGAWQLVHGSALFVRPSCASVSWGDWRGGPNSADALPAEYCVHGDEWLLGRVVMPQSTGIEWIERIASEVRADTTGTGVQVGEIGQIPQVTASLSLPGMVARVLPSTDTPCSMFVASAGRPFRGALFPAPAHEYVPEVEVNATLWAKAFAWVTRLKVMATIG